MGHYFVCYKREFVITVIVITEFDCSSFDIWKKKKRLKQNCFHEKKIGTEVLL